MLMLFAGAVLLAATPTAPGATVTGIKDATGKPIENARIDHIVTVELANSLAKARDAADAKLNAAYKQLRSKLDAADDQRPIVAQRLWIQYRSANHELTAFTALVAAGTVGLGDAVE